MKIPYRKLAKQPPAGTVWPVLIPSHPFPNNLFVFFHFFNYFIRNRLSSYNSEVYSSEFIISLKLLF